MAWLIFFVLAWGLVVVLVGPRHLTALWPAGLIAIIVSYLVDSTLVKMGAFKFNDLYISVGGVPFFYLLANFANGMTLVRLTPQQGMFRPVIIVSLALLFLLMEYLAIMFGYFTHLNWNLWYSAILNILGFTLILWATKILHSASLHSA